MVINVIIIIKSVQKGDVCRGGRLLASVIVNVEEVWMGIEPQKLMSVSRDSFPLHTHTRTRTHLCTHAHIPHGTKIGLLGGSVNHIECIAIPIPFIP